MCSLTSKGTPGPSSSKFGMPRGSKQKKAALIREYTGEPRTGGTRLDETIFRVLFLRLLSVWMPLESLEVVGHIVECYRHK